MGVDWRKLRSEILGSANVGIPDHLNKEDFPSYRISDREMLLNVLMTGSTGDTYYQTGIRNVFNVAGLLKRFNDDEFLAKAILYARLEGYMRDMPILGLVALSVKNPQLFKEIAPRVCRTPTDWVKLIDMCRSGLFRAGLGRAVKSAIIEGIRNTDVYQAMKYPSAVRTMIRLARPHTSVNPTVIGYIMERRYDGDERLEALYKLRRTNNPKLASRLIEEYVIPYEVVTSIGNIINYRDVWEALLRVAPYMNLIRNLRTFYNKGVFSDSDNVDFVVSRLKDIDAIKSSMVLPIRFVTAYTSIVDIQGMPDEIVSAVADALEMSISNIKRTKDDIVVALDDSGSMLSGITSNRSKTRLYHVGRAMAWSLMYNALATELILFGRTVRINKAKELLKYKRDVDFIIKLPPYGGTSLSAPMRYILEETGDCPPDRVIFITDNEEWVGEPFIKPLTEFINKYPSVNVYLVTLMPYMDYPTPNMRNVHYVFGWNDNVLRYLTDSHRVQIDDVLNVKI